MPPLLERARGTTSDGIDFNAQGVQYLSIVLADSSGGSSDEEEEVDDNAMEVDEEGGDSGNKKAQPGKKKKSKPNSDDSSSGKKIDEPWCGGKCDNFSRCNGRWGKRAADDGDM